MPEYERREKSIERRTYLKGRFKGKFVGSLDAEKSDLRYENFYDLEVLSGEIWVQESDFRIWRDGGEFEDFAGVELFLTKLPATLPCTVLYKNGSVKHFNVGLHEAKLKNYKLSDRLYEADKLFAVIEGEISGYLKFFDREDEWIEKPAPKIVENIIPPPPVAPTTAATFDAGRFDGTGGGGAGTDWNGCFSGCLTIIAGLVALYVALALFTLLFSTVAGALAGTVAVMVSFAASVFLPLLFVGGLLYIFVRLRGRLNWFWQLIFYSLIFLAFSFFLIELLH